MAVKEDAGWVFVGLVLSGSQDIIGKDKRNNSGIQVFHLYRPLLDSWMLFDNSADLPRLIADEESGNLTVIDDKLFSTIERSSN